MLSLLPNRLMGAIPNMADTTNSGNKSCSVPKQMEVEY